MSDYFEPDDVPEPGKIESDSPDVLNNPVALNVRDVFSGDDADQTEARNRLFYETDYQPFDTAPRNRDFSRMETLFFRHKYITKSLKLPFPQWVFAFYRKSDDFYRVGEPQYKTIYIPVFQVLCEGGAEERFVSNIHYSSLDPTNLAVELEMKGCGVNYDSSGSLAVSFKTLDEVSGPYQVALPARLKIETLRHRTNDDLTEIRSAIEAVGSDATLIAPREEEFAQLEGLVYKSDIRFGLPDNLEKRTYKVEKGDMLKCAISFTFLNETGKFGLTATIKSSNSLEVSFRSTKKGVFKRFLADSSHLAQKFDASEVDFG